MHLFIFSNNWHGSVIDANVVNSSLVNAFNDAHNYPDQHAVNDKHVSHCLTC